MPAQFKQSAPPHYRRRRCLFAPFVDGGKLLFWTASSNTDRASRAVNETSSSVVDVADVDNAVVVVGTKSRRTLL
uniref:Uncharacterized protein n=1 Tax=Steinernema glaseri TaxID=37863 RepID=A0A1I7ZK30_9BILA